MKNTFILLDDLKKQYGWKSVLDRIKTPYIVSKEYEKSKVMIVSDLSDLVLKNVEVGNVAIIENPDLSKLGFKKYGKAFVSRTYFPEYEILNIRSPMFIDIYKSEDIIGYGLQNENRITKGGLENGKLPILIKIKYGKGMIFAITGDLSNLLFMHGNNLRRFSKYSEITERTTVVDKREVSDVLYNVIKEAHRVLDIPLFTLSYYPKRERTVFMVRIDVDGVFKENVGYLSNVCVENGVKGSFFVNKDMCLKEKEYLKSISDIHDIGNHGVVHNVFDTYEENYENIKNCESWVKEQVGVFKKMFIAPRGMYNDQLGQALLDNGYTFSSDFGYIIDGYPQFTLIDGKQSNLLQIPCNAFCVGRGVIYYEDMGKQITDEEIIKYYKDMIDEKIQTKEPIIIYGHPKEFGKRYHILDKVIKYLKEKDIKSLTMLEFEQWWRRRHEVEVEVVFNSAEKEYEVTLNDEALFVEIADEYKYKVNYKK